MSRRGDQTPRNGVTHCFYALLNFLVGTASQNGRCGAFFILWDAHADVAQAADWMIWFLH
jgi:hypothetical protein